MNKYVGAVLRDAHLVVGVTLASEMCHRAQEVHKLGTTSAVALGRLMIATVLTSHSHRRTGALSFQVMAQGRLHQAFADITSDGNVRGFVRPADLAMPPLSEAERLGRRSIAHAVGAGLLSAIRTPDSGDFTQSTTELLSGEIDADVEHFVTTSDQIPTALVADVLLDTDGKVHHAGGVIVQGMPHADLAVLANLRYELAEGRFAASLSAHTDGADSLLTALFPQAEITEAAEVRFKCRCSKQRVLAAMALLDVADIADLANGKEPAEVGCDFCGTTYSVSPDDFKGVFDAVLQAAKASQN